MISFLHPCHHFYTQWNWSFFACLFGWSILDVGLHHDRIHWRGHTFLLQEHKTEETTTLFYFIYIKERKCPVPVKRERKLPPSRAALWKEEQRVTSRGCGLCPGRDWQRMQQAPAVLPRPHFLGFFTTCAQLPHALSLQQLVPVLCWHEVRLGLLESLWELK